MIASECLDCKKNSGVVMDCVVLPEGGKMVEHKEWICSLCGKEWRSRDYYEYVHTKTKIHYYEEGEEKWPLTNTEVASKPVLLQS